MAADLVTGHLDVPDERRVGVCDQPENEECCPHPVRRKHLEDVVRLRDHMRGTSGHSTVQLPLDQLVPVFDVKGERVRVVHRHRRR
jgi:hypothetical protein